MISWNTTTHVQEKNYSKMRTVERLDQIASNHYARTDDKKVLGGRKGWGEGIVVVRLLLHTGQYLVACTK